MAGRRTKCGLCEKCSRPDCGECPPCKDKLKFGGKGRRCRACTAKRCSAKTVKNTKIDNQPAINTLFKKTLNSDLDQSLLESKQKTRVDTC